MTKDNSTPRPWRTGREDMQSYTGDGEIAFTNIYADNPNGKIHLGHKLPFTVGRAEGENNKANARLIVRAVNRDHVFEELVAALKQLNRGSIENPCFCDMAIGHPLMRGHSKGCLLSQEALSKASKLTEEKNDI